MRHCKAKSVAYCVSLFSVQTFHRSQTRIRRNRVSPEALRCSFVGGAAALSLPSPNLLPYGQSDTSNLLYPLELEGGSSTSRCNNFAITDTLSHRDDLQPLLPGASSANVHLPLTEGSQSRDEAMEFVTISLFGLVCYLDILRVVALGPQSQKLRKIQIILSCLSASCLSSVPCFTSSLQ